MNASLFLLLLVTIPLVTAWRRSHGGYVRGSKVIRDIRWDTHPEPNPAEGITIPDIPAEIYSKQKSKVTDAYTVTELGFTLQLSKVEFMTIVLKRNIEPTKKKRSTSSAVGLPVIRRDTHSEQKSRRSNGYTVEVILPQPRIHF